MADGQTITQFTELAAADVTNDDVLPIVDVHDQTQAPSGTTKKVQLGSLFTDPTFAGTLTADVIEASGRITTSDETDATDATDGSIQTDGGLSVTKKGFFGDVITASGIAISAAIGKLIPGATSFSIRNHTDTADNLALTDSGSLGVRHMGGIGGAPTITIQSGDMTISSSSGTDTNGQIVLTVASSPSDTKVRITFSTPFTGTPYLLTSAVFVGTLSVNTPAHTSTGANPSTYVEFWVYAIDPPSGGGTAVITYHVLGV